MVKQIGICLLMKYNKMNYLEEKKDEKIIRIN